MTCSCVCEVHVRIMTGQPEYFEPVEFWQLLLVRQEVFDLWPYQQEQTLTRPNLRPTLALTLPLLWG